METWAATKKALYECGGDISFYSGPYPKAACPEYHVGFRLGREYFTLPYAAADAYRSGTKKSFFHTRSVAVTPTPVRIPT